MSASIGLVARSDRIPDNGTGCRRDDTLIKPAMSDNQKARGAFVALQLLSGPSADRLLNDPGHHEQWRNLLSKCPWATVFQSPGFILTWYQCYQHLYEPLIIARYDGSSELTGVLHLARKRGDARWQVVHAGANQAEYQVWLATESDRGKFIVEALAELHKYNARLKLSLKYLPAATPLSAFKQSPYLQTAFLTEHQRPIITVSDEASLNALSKKRIRKWKFTELEKRGSLRLVRLTDPSEIITALDTIIDYYDLRQGTLYYNVFPFRNDSTKRDFHIALADVPGLLHVTVLRLDRATISGCLCLVDQTQAIHALGGYAPNLGRLSVGLIHLLFLCSLLRSEGFLSLDLTPGGVYKDRLSQKYETVTGLQVNFNPLSFWSSRLRGALRNQASRLLSSIGALELIKALPNNSARLVGQLASCIWKPRILERILAPDREGVIDLPLGEINKNNIHDLLDVGLNRAALVDSAIWLESGNDCYTYSVAGKAKSIAWVASGSKRCPERRYLQLNIPSGDAVIYGFVGGTKPDFTVLLYHIMALLARSGANRVYAYLDSGDPWRESVLIESGFRRTSREEVAELLGSGKPSGIERREDGE